MAYIVPKIDLENFFCRNCKSNCQHQWTSLYERFNGVNFYLSQIKDKELKISRCTVHGCYEKTIWLGDKIIYPKSSVIEQPVDIMPVGIKSIYNEARDVFNDSPKSSAALLRLAIEKLCKDIKKEAKDLNEAIKLMVSDGLDEKIQKALDTLRVIGNNSVHPGQINIDDNSEMAKSLFFLINYIVEKMIAEPKKIDDLYSNLPENIKKEIEKRDKKNNDLSLKK